jgi:hypothetical protein
VPEDRVLEAARTWAEQLRRDYQEVVRVGYFGSYARGDYVPGSDLDVLIELSRSDLPHWRDCAVRYRPDSFPVGMDVFAHTSAELAALRAAGAAFVKTIDAEIRWLAWTGGVISLD